MRSSSCRACRSRRFGQNARSQKMVSSTGILQVNVNTENSRDVRRVAPMQPQQQQMVQVQVPPNAYPGMHVQARIPDGRTIDVPIPAGVMPGSIISVAVPAQAPPMMPRLQNPGAAQRPQMPAVGGPVMPQMPTMQRGNPQMPAMPGQYARPQHAGDFVGPPAQRPVGGGAAAAIWTQLEMRDCPEIVGQALNEMGPAVFVETPMDNVRRTIVHKACSFGRLQTLQAIGAVLQAAGRNALLNQQDATGKRSIDCAAERGQAHVVKWLLAHGAPVSQAQTLGAQHPAVAALFGAQAPQGGAVNAARALAKADRRRPRRPHGVPLCGKFYGAFVLNHRIVLHAIDGPRGARPSRLDLVKHRRRRRVRTLGTFEEHELKGIANELGMNFGHGHKFADACKQVRNRTHAPQSGLGDDAAALLLQKMNAIEQQGQARDRAIADVTQGLHHIDEGVHHIDETTTKTAQSVEQIKAKLDEVVAKTRGQTRLLADLCAGTTECPKLVWMARADPKGLASWISPSAWYGKRVKIQFVCPVSMKVGPGPGFELTLSKDWMKKYGVALNVSLGILRLAMQVGAAAMGCHHCHIADMSVDRARLKNADDLYAEVTKGLDKDQQEALEKGAPLGKQLAEASFQALLRDITKEHGEHPNFGLVRSRLRQVAERGRRVGPPGLRRGVPGTGLVVAAASRQGSARSGPIFTLRASVRHSDASVDAVQHLARRRAALEVLVALGRLVEREGRVHRDLELAALEPAHDLVRAVEELLAVPRVVQELRPAHEARLGDVAQRRVGRHRAGRVAEGHEDAPLRERAEGHVERRLADAVDHGLAARAVRDLQNFGETVDALVVLVGRARRLVVQDQFINTRGLADVALALGAGPNHLVAADLGHLRRPLARAAPDAMNQHPLARLDELRVGVRREVVRRQTLDDARNSHVHGHVVRYGQALGRRHGRVLGITPEDRVRDLVADLDVLDIRPDGDDLAAALLASHKGQIAGVQARAVVRVNKVDAREGVLHQHLARRDVRHGEVTFHFQRVGGAGLAHHSSLHDARDAQSSRRRAARRHARC